VALRVVGKASRGEAGLAWQPPVVVLGRWFRARGSVRGRSVDPGRPIRTYPGLLDPDPEIGTRVAK
jgi:hypothetical protein